MKYEMIFGDERLFDGMMGDCEFASEEYGYIFANGALYYCERYNEKAGWALSCKSHLTFKPSAMRRIIKEPKRWTWKSLGSKVYFFSLDSFQRPVSMACCLFLCRKYGRKTTDFI